jgi:hypothetical protein
VVCDLSIPSCSQNKQKIFYLQNIKILHLQNINYCHTAIENLSDPIGYLIDFTNPYYTALAGNMKACAKKEDNSF